MSSGDNGLRLAKFCIKSSQSLKFFKLFRAIAYYTIILRPWVFIWAQCRRMAETSDTRHAPGLIRAIGSFRWGFFPSVTCHHSARIHIYFGCKITDTHRCLSGLVVNHGLTSESESWVMLNMNILGESGCSFLLKRAYGVDFVGFHAVLYDLQSMD